MALVKDTILNNPDEYKTLLDYGCGRGDDVRSLNRNRIINAIGYDPHFYDLEENLARSDIVTCFFVLNVIDDSNERIKVIKHVLELAKKEAYFAVRCWTKENIAAYKKAVGDGLLYNDGIISSKTKNTFQKFYHPEEFGSLLGSITGLRTTKMMKNGETGVWVVYK